MEYERTEDGQIQAAFARRVGNVLLQYGARARDFAPEEQYEATLCVCLLQAVLTQCVEAINRNGGSLNAELDAVLKVSLKDQPPRFGFDKDCIEVWGHTSGPPTYRDLVTMMRHALSHPTSQSETGHPTTGYITVLDGTGLIQNFRFVASPWAEGCKENQRVKYEGLAKRLLEPTKWAHLQWRKRRGMHFLDLNGEPVVPHTIVTLSVLQLRTLTLELSDLLGTDPGPGSGSLTGRQAHGTRAKSPPIIHGVPDGRG